MANPIIHIDLDNCLADFNKSFNYKKSINPGIAYPQCEYAFFENLEPIEGAIDAVNELRTKFEVYILTRPSVKNPHSYTSKRIWVEKYFGLYFCENLIIASRKGLLLLKGQYLIDDNLYPEFEGEQLLFGSSQFPNWKSVLEYFFY